MIGNLIDRIGTLFDNLAIPGEIVDVFEMMTEIWESIPFSVRYVLIGCFSVACIFAVLKMLF